MNSRSIKFGASFLKNQFRIYARQEHSIATPPTSTMKPAQLFTPISKSTLNNTGIPVVQGRVRTENGPETMKYVKIGYGPHVIVFMPGAIGSWITDYRPQMFAASSPFVRGMLAGHYTLVGIDPPGQGLNQDQARQWPLNTPDRDAHGIATALENAGIDRYSIVSWSSGTAHGVIIASQYPKRVRRLVFSGSGTFQSHYTTRLLEQERDPETWPDEGAMVYRRLYGKDNYKTMWTNYVNGSCDVYFQRCVRDTPCGKPYTSQVGDEESSDKYEHFKWPGESCRARIPSVQSPVLLFWGDRDQLAPRIQLEPYFRMCKNLRYEYVKGGKHHMHLNKHTMNFYNNTANSFLMEEAAIIAAEKEAEKEIEGPTKIKAAF